MASSVEEVRQDEEFGTAQEAEQLLGGVRSGSNSDDGEDCSDLPRLASNKQQLKAMLHRQWLFKVRKSQHFDLHYELAGSVDWLVT